MFRYKQSIISLFIVVWGIVLSACSQSSNEPIIIYVTATPSSVIIPTSNPTILNTPVPTIELSLVPQAIDVAPTLNPPRFDALASLPQQHVVQSGDTLIAISDAYGVSLDSILENNELLDPNVLSVGQVINLPDLPQQLTPNFKIIPDSRMVRGPGSQDFDIDAFIDQQPGYIRNATDEVTSTISTGERQTEILPASQVIQRVALEYSVDPRLLIAILEYRSNWLSRLDIGENLITHPLLSADASSGIDRSGLYRQLSWVANALNLGYYGWKNRGWITLELGDGSRYLFADGLNAGTVAVQYLFSRNLNITAPQWQFDISPDGFYRTYFAYFGNPFEGALDPLVPADLQQPTMMLPFSQGQTWFYTGGAHGGWGSGSAWSAIDFAPPDERDILCFISDYWVRAVASGLIVRSDDGAVVLDLDGDGDEATGWTVLYLHLAEAERVQVGTQVAVGDEIGRASCEGGFSTATHLHIARRYNGEWIPADCQNCGNFDYRPPFVLSSWRVVGIQNQEYQGFLENGGDRLTAEQGRLTPINRISW